MVIRKTLELSTAHLSTHTAQRMSLFSMVRHEFGWLVSVDTTGDTYPNDLHACMVLAESNGCDYILFDSDVEPIEDLPTYDW